MSNTIPFIVTETPNGRAFVKNVFICYGEADFISRIRQVAMRSDADIQTMEDAIEYLNERYAQSTEVVTKEGFDALTPDSWDQIVLDKAEFLGWYTAPSQEDDE